MGNKAMQKGNKTENMFLEKISKIDKPLARLIKKKMQKTQITNIRNERGDIATNSADIKMQASYAGILCPTGI